MRFIDTQLIEFKRLMEDAIIEGGVRGKTSIIRSSALINLIHDAVKFELIEEGVNPENIYPRLGETKPEIKIAGFLKQKNQDVCVLPNNIEKKQTLIDWGPLAFKEADDPYGEEYSSNTLVINIRSQMSSLDKNADTLFERTFAESLNLHLRYPRMVLGEVYLIPAYEYDDELVKTNTVGFKANHSNIERYLSFFDAINNRSLENDVDDYAYERVTLLIVDFNREIPKLYNSTEELVNDGLLREDFPLTYEGLNYDNFAKDILNIYAERFNINIIKL